MKAKQFAWFYLIEHGHAGVVWSHYGGVEWHDDRIKKIQSEEEIKIKYLEEIRTIGVDWEKTNAPSNDGHSMYNGTDNDNGWEEHIEGLLVLKNGLKQTWVAESIKVREVFNIMADPHEFVHRMSQLFGEI